MRLCNIAERLFIAEAPPALEHFQLLGIYMQIWMPARVIATTSYFKRTLELLELQRVILAVRT